MSFEMSTRVFLHTKLRNLDGSAFHALGLVSEGCIHPKRQHVWDNEVSLWCRAETTVSTMLAEFQQVGWCSTLENVKQGRRSGGGVLTPSKICRRGQSMFPHAPGAPAGFQARVGKIRRKAPKKIFSVAHPGFQFAHPAIRNGCPPCPPYRGGFKGKSLVGH